MGPRDPTESRKGKGKQVLMPSRAQVRGEDRCSLGMKPAAQKRLWIPDKNQKSKYTVKKLR